MACGQPLTPCLSVRPVLHGTAVASGVAARHNAGMITSSALRGLWMLAAACAAAVASAEPVDAAGPLSAGFRAALTQHGVNATDPDHAGIWKAATPPPGSVRGEFDSNDPLGLAAGSRIKADCSINWIDPDSGKRYCFSSATSLVVFLDEPHGYLRRATQNWDGATTARGTPLR